jgi:dihydrofolate reductase
MSSKFSIIAAVYVANRFMNGFKHNGYPINKGIRVIGGETVYREAIKHPDCESIYITRINEDFKCDQFFPPLDCFTVNRQFEHVNRAIKDNLIFDKYDKIGLTSQ